MRPWHHQVIKGQWRHIARKWFIFYFWRLKMIHGHSKTIVTCSNRRKEHAGRWNFALAPSEAVIGDHGFSSLFVTWPDLRGHWLTFDLKLIYQSLRLAESYTLVFFREALSQSGAKRHGGGVVPSPLVPWKDAKWPVPARLKCPKSSSGPLL